jgi:alpha-L-fucosidase
MAFEPTLESVRQHVLPEWFSKAKLGIFIHWGLYSVPAWAPPGDDIDRQVAEKGWQAMFANNPYAEWYQNSLRVGDTPTRRHHAATYGAEFAYEDFAAEFNQAVEAWNPDDWAALFNRVGARYVVLTSKHHEGFLLWPSARTSPKHAPGFSTTRDLVGELTDAVRRHGMRMGLYYSGGLDWTFESRPVLDFPDVQGTIVQSPEFIDYVNAHFRELIDRYAPSVLWNDIGYPAGGNSPELFAYYYNTVPEGVINDRWSQKQIEAVTEFGVLHTGTKEFHYDYITPEYSTYTGIQPTPWEMCRGIGHSFGYNQTEGADDYLPVEALVRLLVDVVSKNGNLLLNVGPTADGLIPDLQRERLVGLGNWLAVNGEAIFDTSPWTVAEAKTRDGINVRFTQKDGALYAILLARPETTSITLDTPEDVQPQAVYLLGKASPLQFEDQASSLTIHLPEALASQPAYAFRISSAQ